MKTQIYWQAQGVDRLCGVHCINSLLQGPFFNEITLANIALQLDNKERELMASQGMTKDFLKYMQQQSGNVAMDGYYSVQVLQAALKSINLTMISVETKKSEDFLKKIGFIFNSSDHWFSLRKIDGVWYNLNSTNRRMPQIISQFYFQAFVSGVVDQGYSIFSVQGVYPQSSEDKFEYYNKNQMWFPKKRIQKYHEKCIKRKNFKPNIRGAGTDHQMQKALAMSLGKKYQPYISSGQDSDWDDDNPKKKQIKHFAGQGAYMGEHVYVNYQKFYLSDEQVEMIDFLKVSLSQQFSNIKSGKQVTFRYSSGKKQTKLFPADANIQILYDYIWHQRPFHSKFYLTNFSNKQKLIDVQIPLFAIQDQDESIYVIVNDQ